MYRKLIFLACFVFLLGLFLTDVAQSELVGWWKLDEGTGVTAYDSSSNAFDGTLIADTRWVAGKYGAAVELDGTGDGVEIPPIGINSDTVTMSAWIKRNGPQTDYAGLFFTRNMPTNDLACGFMMLSGGTSIGYTWNDNSQATWGWGSGLVIPDNEWCFVVLVVEPTQATMYVNEDYANVKGFEFTLDIRPDAYFSGGLTYTYMIAKGSASSETEQYPGTSESTQLYFLNFDRTHVLNASASFRVPDGEGPTVFGAPIFQNIDLSLILRASSGAPYTPSGRDVGFVERNSLRQPGIYTIDMILGKSFYLLEAIETRIFVEIFNLTDHQNILYVYPDTGDPDFTVVGNQSVEYMRDPSNYGPPRTIRLGASIGF